MELIKLGKNTYYIKGNTNIGVYKLNETDCVIIDTGFTEQAIEVYNLLNSLNLKIKYVINTHSHPDHSAGNNFFIKNTNCKLITSKIERAFLRNHNLDLAFLYGGFPLKEFDTKLLHIEEQREILTLLDLPKGLSYFKLPGHTHDMFGIKTDDSVYFVADAVGNTFTINKYHILLIYDVLGYLKTLDLILSFNGNYIVPSHVEATKDITKEVLINKQKIQEICDYLLLILKDKLTHDEILTNVFDHFNLKIGYNQYLIAGASIRSYLAYLDNLGLIKTCFINNRLYFEAI